MLLVVNYHYIRDKIPHAGIHPITPSFFKKQLELISANGYKFVSVEQFFRLRFFIVNYEPLLQDVNFFFCKKDNL